MIVFNDAFHGQAICDEIGVVFNPRVDATIARVSNNGVLMGGSVFQNYTGSNGSISIHVASFLPNWINPDLLLVTFHYPFVRLNCRKLFGTVKAGNTEALNFDLKLGFTQETRVADVYPDDDMILLSMRREDCRWLSIRPRTIQLKEAA